MLAMATILQKTQRVGRREGDRIFPRRPGRRKYTTASAEGGSGTAFYDMGWKGGH